MKEVTFYFADGHKETFDTYDPQINPADFRMYGVAAHQQKSTAPEDWMDDYNDWSEDEGNTNRSKGDCTGFDFV